nr:MAG TPA: hypothetical protein [Caudoviricetes sp.]
MQIPHHIGRCLHHRPLTKNNRYSDTHVGEKKRWQCVKVRFLLSDSVLKEAVHSAAWQAQKQKRKR